MARSAMNNDVHMPALTAITPPIDVSEAAWQWLRVRGSAADVQAKEPCRRVIPALQRSVAESSGSNCAVKCWGVPVAGGSSEGLPLLALGCGQQVYVLTTQDGDDALQLVCCMEPRSGAVLALSWSLIGDYLAVCTQNEILVYSLRASSGRSGISRMILMGAEWFVTHRMDSKLNCTLSWGVLSNESVLLTGGAGASKAWKVPVLKTVPGDYSGQKKVSTLVPIGMGSFGSGRHESVQGDLVDGDVAGQHQLILSPDSCWTAACTAFGRIVSLKRVQSASGGAGVSRALLLPHPRSVSSFQWRPRIQQSQQQHRQKPLCGSNALVTCCRDGQIRVWKEIGGGVDAQDAVLTNEASVLSESFTLCFVAGAREKIPTGLPQDFVCTSSWVVDVVSGYESSGASVKKSKTAKEEEEVEGWLQENLNDAASCDCALLAAVQGGALVLWALTGLGSFVRRSVSVSTVMRTNLQHLASSLDAPCVDVRVFRCAVSPSHSVGVQDRARLSIVLTDVGGVVHSTSMPLITSNLEDGRSLRAREHTSNVLSSMHKSKCKFLAEGSAQLSVIADEIGAISFWSWDLNPVGPIARRPVLRHAGIWRPKAGSCDVARLDSCILVAERESKMVRLLSLKLSNPDAQGARVQVVEDLVVSRREKGTLESLCALQLEPSGWLCVVALARETEGDMSIWCGGMQTQGRVSNSEATPWLEPACIECEVPHVTCIHVPNCKSSSANRSPSSESPASSRFLTSAKGFFFAGDKRGRVHLLSATFSVESGGGVSGSVRAISSFGDQDLGCVLHVCAQALGCVATVHAGDPHRVHVWRASSSCDSFTRVSFTNISGISEISSLAWLEPVPLFPLLAVGTASSIHMVARVPVTEAKQTSKWTWGTQWSARVSGCTSVAWTADCRMLACCMGGVLVFEPTLTARQRGLAAGASALSGHAGFTFCSVVRQLQAPAAGIQILQEHLREMLASLKITEPQCLLLHWSAGHRTVLDGILSHICDTVSEQGVSASLAHGSRLDNLRALLDAEAGSKDKVQTDSSTSLFDTGLLTGFGGLGDFGQGSSGNATVGTAELCQRILKHVDEADRSGEDGGEKASIALRHLCPVLNALVAALADTSDRLDEQAQRFSFAVRLREEQRMLENKSRPKKTNAYGQEMEEDVDIEYTDQLDMVDIAWGLLSGEQDTMVRKLIPEDFSWGYLRFLGAPLWISSPSTLKAVAEKLARAQFKKDKDPTASALLYLCLDKKTMLAAMFKAVRNDLLHKFFSRNFDEEQHRVAALKNACVLLSKHKYPLAAAFFILAGKFSDAFDTVLKKMEDPMLALFISRLYSKADSGETYGKTMATLLDKWREAGDEVAVGLVLWRLGRFQESIATLAESGKGLGKSSFDLIRILSVYSFMRADPRMRLSASEEPHKTTPVGHGHGGMVQDAAAQRGSYAHDIFSTANEPRDTNFGQDGDSTVPHSGGRNGSFAQDVLSSPKGIKVGWDSMVNKDPPDGGAQIESAAGNKPEACCAVASVCDMLRLEIGLRQAMALEFTEECLMDFALEQCKLIGALQVKLELELEGSTVRTPSDRSPLVLASKSSVCELAFEHRLFSRLRDAILDRFVRQELPFTPDHVHPKTLQHKDPARIIESFQIMCDALSGCGLEADAGTLIVPALHECATLARVDCYTALSVTSGTATEGFELLTQTTLVIPHALKTLPVLSRSAEAASYFQRMAQRLSAAGSTMATACGQPGWLGDCLHLDALYRRLCIAAYLCAFLAFWHSYDSAGLQLLLCGMWDERASNSTDCAMALAFYAQRALARVSCLHRCAWARVWARYEKQLASLHASSGPVMDQPYLSDGVDGVEVLKAQLLELLVLARVYSLLGMAMACGRSEDDTCSMVAVASDAVRTARLRAVHRLHLSAAASVSLDALAEMLQPYLSPASPTRADLVEHKAGEESVQRHLRRLLLASDDKARSELHVAALGLLAHSPCPQPAGSSKIQLGHTEVLVTHKGEVLRSLCVRSDEMAGSVLAVCSNKCIREAHCRPDAVSVVGAGHEGMAVALLPSMTNSSKNSHLTSSGEQIPSSRGEVSGSAHSALERAKERLAGASSSSLQSFSAPSTDEESGSSHMLPAASLLSAVDGVFEMLWDKVSASTAEMVHFVADHPLGAPAPSVGAMALAAHPSLPVFLSGGSDGSVLLWGFGAPQPLSSYHALSGTAINRLRFDEAGAKFCGCDSSGLAGVWNFELSRGGAAGHNRKPVDFVQAHSKRCHDACFFDKGTLLASAGSGSSPSVCVWDLLVPPQNSCAAAMNLHEGSALSLCHAASKHLIVTGGQKGEICVTDTRTWRCLRTLPNAHKHSVRALCISPGGGFVVSGSTDGDIKIWDVADFAAGAGETACVQTWICAHEKGTFVGAGSNTAIATVSRLPVAVSAKFVTLRARLRSPLWNCLAPRIVLCLSDFLCP